MYLKQLCVAMDIHHENTQEQFILLHYYFRFLFYGIVIITSLLLGGWEMTL